MATRTISTRLILDGEKEYRAQIRQINAEYKTLQSELKLVESSFKGQQNTMAALEAKYKALDSAVKKQNEALKTEQDALKRANEYRAQYSEAAEKARQEMQRLVDSTDAAGKETEEYQKRLKEIQADINKYAKAEQTAAEKAELHTRRSNEAQVKLNDLGDQLRKTEKYLEEASESTDKCATSIDRYGKEVKEAADNSKDFGDTSKRAVDSLAEALAAAGVAASIREISRALTECVDASVRFESAMAGVAKTTDLTDEELAGMSDSIKQLTTEIPITAEELAGIVEAAGRLGIANDELLTFSKVMADLGVATNLTSEEAADSLARLGNITGLLAEDYSRLGSSVVALGNNFATTERDIVEMSTRLASAGTLAGLSEAEILALAAAMSSVGIEAEAGGTAMTQTLNAISKSVAVGGEKVSEFARIAGMSADQFSSMWGSRPIEALRSFIAGLGGLESQGESATAALEGLGLSGIRQSNMLRALGLAADTMTSAIQLSNKAWEENNALTKEAETRYETTESKMTMYKNSVENLKIAVGDQLTPALENLAEVGTGVNAWAADFVAANPELVQLTTSLLAGTAAFVGMATAIGVVSKAWGALRGLLSASTNPWTLAISAAGALATALITLASASSGVESEYTKMVDGLKKSSEEYQSASKAISEEKQNTEDLAATVLLLASNTEKNENQQRALLESIDALNVAVPELNLAYDAQTDSLNMTTDALYAMIEAEYERQQMVEDIERHVELEREIAEASAAHQKAVEELAEAETKYNELLAMTGPNIDQMGRFISEAEQAVINKKAAVDELDSSLSVMNDEFGALTTTIEGYGISTEAAAAQTTTSSAEMTAALSDLQGQLAALEEAYTSSFEAAYKGIDETVSLFKELDGTATQSIRDLISALESQIVFMNDYAVNLKEAARLGVDEGLIQALSDGSEESARILAAIVEDGGKNIAELNERLREVKEGKRDFAETVAQMDPEFQAAASSIMSDADQLIIHLNSAMNQFDASPMLAEVEMIKQAINELNSMSVNVSIPDASSGRSKGWQSSSNFHAAGLSYVPYDNYPANLHEGEMVLTRLQAQAYRAEQFATYSEPPEAVGTVQNVYFSPVINVTDTKEAASTLARDLKWELRNRGII